jgi:cysteinyl-tRNA synthetase (EC 6.1.1.16)
VRIFNTATRQVEEFVTYTPGLARGYVCGITPYDHMHIGHGRVYVFFDMFRRYLEAKGYEVRLVINFTDVDDKIINRAREELGAEAYKRWREVPERYIAEFFELSKRLFIKPAYAYPRVTENIEDMIRWISVLVEKGHAYVAPDGSVYFEVAKVSNYGVLSRQKIEELIAGARVEPEPGKKTPSTSPCGRAGARGSPGGTPRGAPAGQAGT